MMLSSRHLSIGLCALALLVSAACTPAEQKISKKFDAAIAKCKGTQETFAELTLSHGEKRKVLRSACAMPIGKVKMTDAFHGEASMGPYTLRAGQEDKTGIWVLASIDWEPMSTALSELDVQDRDEASFTRVVTALGEAEKGMPDEPWIKVTRFENMLAIRKRERAKATDTTLGKETEDYYASIIKWAGDKSQPAVAQKVRLMVVDYYNAYKQFLGQNLEAGDSDERLKTAIQHAENKEQAAKYQAELDKLVKSREAAAKAAQEKIAEIQKRLCAEAPLLSEKGIEDKDLKVRISATQSGIKCDTPPGQ